jgi:O-antigen ligase
MVDRRYFRLSTTEKNISNQVLIFVSLVLLLASSTDVGFVGIIAKFLWLLTLIIICTQDIGAAFAIYIVSVAIYNAYHVLSPSSLLDRLDNIGLVLFVIFAILRVKIKALNKTAFLSCLILMFVFSALIQARVGNYLEWYSFSQFLRMFGLPLICFVLLRLSSPSLREVRSFFMVIMILGAYMAVISIFEKLNLYSFIVPFWISEPSINVTIGSGRSGGPILQSEFNGFALGLIYCITLGEIYLRKNRIPIFKYLILVLCILGVYFTFTRAAWLAVLVASFFFLFLSSSSSFMKSFRFLASIPIAVVLLIMLFVFPSQLTKERASDTGTINYRINLWAAGLKMASRKPVFGHGISQFQVGAPDYQARLGFVPELFIPKMGTGAHNVFINILVEQGIFGLIIYILIIRQVFLLSKVSSDRIFSRFGASWISAFTIIYFINAQFVNIHEPTTNLIYFGTMGLIAGLKKRKIKRSKDLLTNHEKAVCTMRK